MISAGDTFLGRFIEEEVHGEAFVEVQRVFLSWSRPQPPWPVGTTFSEPRKERQWSSLTSWAILPAGVRYELLLERRDGEPDPREIPPVLWSIHAESSGVLYACPRIAQMHVTFDPPHPVTDERKLDAYAGVPIGLERRYCIGRLSRSLQEETRTVSEGWGYR